MPRGDCELLQNSDDVYTINAHNPEACWCAAAQPRCCCGEYSIHPTQKHQGAARQPPPPSRRALRDTAPRTRLRREHDRSARLFVRFVPPMAQTEANTLEELNERIVDAFLKNRKRDSHDGAPQAFRRLLGILRASGVTPPAEPPSRTPAQRIADDIATISASSAALHQDRRELLPLRRRVPDRPVGADRADLSRWTLRGHLFCPANGAAAKCRLRQGPDYRTALVPSIPLSARKNRNRLGAVSAGNRPLASHWAAETTARRNGGTDFSRVRRDDPGWAAGSRDSSPVGSARAARCRSRQAATR